MYYQNHPDHGINNQNFATAIVPYNLDLFRPSPEKAPWHLQTKIDFGHYPIVLNFWPHKMKAQREGFKAVEGINAVCAMIETAINEALNDIGQDFDLIEGI